MCDTTKYIKKNGVETSTKRLSGQSNKNNHTSILVILDKFTRGIAAKYATKYSVDLVRT